MQLGRRRGTMRISSPLRVKSSHNSLVASGQKIRKRDEQVVRRLIQPWQSRAFYYYDNLGEVKFASQFYSRSLASLTLYAAEKDADGELVPTENPEAIRYLERIQDPGGGRTGLLSTYGRLMFLVGECYLFVSMNPDTEEEQWEMLSTDELRIIGGSYTRFKAPSIQAEEYREPADDDFEPIDDKSAVAYRLWKRHPRFSLLADSSVQSVIMICEELEILTLAVRAQANSRLAGRGILFIPEEISPAPLEPVGDEDPEEDIFLRDLIEAARSALQDEGSAAAAAPLIVRGPAEYLDKVKHLMLSDPTQLYPETGLRRECIERLGIGLDLPPEVLTGLASANHWTGWLVSEESWKAHLQPMAEQLVDDLSSSYYRPALKEAGLADWQKYWIAYDATAIINHPDRTKDAKDLWDKGAISLESLREAAGFGDDDAPTEQDRAERIGIATRDSSLAWYGIPSVKAGGLEPEAGVLEKAGETTVSSPTGATTGAEVTPGPPPEQPLPETVVGALSAATAARILGAADLALLRARESAGNRVRSLAKRDPEALKLVEGVRAGQVIAVLGRERVRALKAPGERELVAGARELILDALRVFGLKDDVAALVADSVEQHAARTLYDEHPAPLPPSFANYLSGLTSADTCRS